MTEDVEKINQAVATAETFSNLYYKKLDNERHTIDKMYHENATMTWNGNPIEGIQNIQKFCLDNIPKTSTYVQSLGECHVTFLYIMLEILIICYRRSACSRQRCWGPDHGPGDGGGNHQVRAQSASGLPAELPHHRQGGQVESCDRHIQISVTHSKLKCYYAIHHEYDLQRQICIFNYFQKMTRLALVLSGLLAASLAATDSINKDLVVTSCDRTIDMSTQLVKMSHKLVIQNNGQGAVKSFLFSIDPTLQKTVSFIEATFGNNDKTYLRVSETKVQSDMDKAFWKIELKSSLASGASTTVTVDVVLGGALEMFPAAITQKEKQLVRLTGNLYAFLPYPVTTQSTRVNLASSNVESYTKVKPVSLSDSTISYGPYSNIAPLTAAEMVIHGENNAPMLVVTRLQRLIELSMWGNIAIEETIDVAHKGAQLKGSFSR